MKCDKRGSVMVTMAVCVAGLAGLATAMVAISLRDAGEQGGAKASIQADYLCQAGLTQAMFQLQTGASPALGSEQSPLEWGGGRFYVTTQDMGNGLSRLTATGLGDSAGARQELVVRAVPNTIWRFGAFGKEFLHMDSNARVDSYNSTSGSYAAQATNGSGSLQYARTNGDVGSNGNVGLDQNAKVWGDAVAGMNHTTTVLGNAIVWGSTANATEDIEFPAIQVPTYTNYGSLTVNSATTLPSSNRTYGTLRVGSNKTLTITGPANIVASNLVLNSGSKIIVDDTNGPVTFHVIDNFIMNSNSQIWPTSNKPISIALNLLSDNVINPEVTVQLDTVDFDSNSKIWGVVYAPNARVVLDSNFELFGSLMARSIDIDSNATFHFDEALIDATASGVPTFETVCWREVPWQH
jgi:hypothetical protein